VQAVCIALRAVAVELLFPFHQIALAAVFLDQPVDGVAGLAVAFGAHDAKHVELTLDVAEDEIGPGQMPSPRWKLMRQRTMFLAEWEMEQ